MVGSMSAGTSKAWRCVVCGYIHRDGEPPDECPVCGAPASEFEAFEEQPVPQAAAPVRKWRCLVCGYVHEGDKPPDECPVCGVGSDSFEPVAEEAAPAATARSDVHIVIVGGGIAGLSAAEAARRTSADCDITLISSEPELPYNRLNLTRFLAGELEERALTMHPARWYEEHRIRLRKGTEVEAISLRPKEVALAGGDKLPFERLIIASGAHAFIPPFPGAKLEGVHALRTLEDARGISGALRPGARCVVIGGGILGLEAAGALVRHTENVTLLEGHSYLMPRQLCERAAGVLGDFVAGIGIRLRRQARTKELCGDDGRVSGVLLEDGDMIPADLVVVATGVRPNSYLARQAGLDVKTGVVVDHLLRTSDPDVFACGDACEHGGVLYGSWAAAQFQGSIAGMNAAGLAMEFGGIPRSHTLKVLGLDMVSVGRFEPEDGSYVVFEDEPREQYRRFVMHDGKLVGAILLGDTRLAAAVTKAMEKGRDFSGVLAEDGSVDRIAGHLSTVHH